MAIKEEATNQQYHIDNINLKLITQIQQITKQTKSQIINQLINKYSLHYLEQNTKPIIKDRHYPISILKSHYQQLFRIRLDTHSN